MSYYDLEPDAQRAANAERLFSYLRNYIVPYHPWLRRRYREAGIDPRRIRSIEDFRKLPIIEKKDLQSAPLMFVLRPALPGGPPLPDGYDVEPLRRSTLFGYAARAALGIPRDPSRQVRHDSLRERVRRLGMLEWLPIHSHFSTGSSGLPTPIAFTHFDIHHVLAEMASLVIKPKNPGPDSIPFEWDERKMSLFPGAPHVAFYAPVIAKILAGSPSFETFGGSSVPTEKQIALFAQGGFQSILAIPSYLIYWLRKAAALQAENKVGPLNRLRRVILGAEPVSEGLRDRLRALAIEAGGMPGLRIIQTAGMTEMKWTFLECAERSGVHLNPKYFHWELLHPETREPVGPREPGVLVFTHIGWRGTALVRYWTGDLIKGGMVWERCEFCGWTFPRIFPPICRAEMDFTKIKGTRVDLSLLTETVRDTPGVRNFQIFLDSESGGEFERDQLGVRVIAERGSVEAEVRELLASRLKAAVEVSPDDVTFEHDEAAFEKRLFQKSSVKAEYVVERRPGRG